MPLLVRSSPWVREAGEIAFWTAGTGIDGQTPAGLDELDLVVILEPSGEPCSRLLHPPQGPVGCIPCVSGRWWRR
jgi:hypothetical protein